MKRVLAAAVISGLSLVLVPQVAFGDHGAGHSGDCAGQTEEAPESERAPHGGPQGDREQEDSDGGELLF